MAKRPVFYVTRFLPGYRVPVMESLNEALEGRLVVFAGLPPGGYAFEELLPSSPYEFRLVQLRNHWIAGDRALVQPFRGAFSRFGPPSVILAEEAPRSLSLPLLMRHAHRINAGLLLWGHFSSNNRPLTLRHPLDRYRLWMAQHADACVCYTEGIADLLKPHVSTDRVFVARNTIDLAPLFKLRTQMETQGRDSIKGSLAIPLNMPVLCFLGRLIPEKGTELLLDVYSSICRKGPAMLLVIGDGPERGAMEARVASDGKENVRFLSTIVEDQKLAQYLFASDVLLNPGYLGLSVNHAFAMGLPVVSRQAPQGIRYHSPEGEYVRDGENGLLRTWDDPDDLVSGVEEALDQRAYLSSGAIRFAENELTLERMVSGLAEAIAFAERR